MSQYIKQLLYSALFLFLATATTKAQTTIDEKAIVSQPKLAIKFAFLPLISTTPAFQLGIETKTFHRQGLQVEFGYVTSALSNSNSDFDGFKLKSEYRFYKKQLNESSKIKFVGIQHLFKVVDVEGEGSIWRNNQSYQQVVPIKVRNTINSVFLVSGFARQLGGPFYIEMAFGIGARFLNVKPSGLPDDAELVTDLNQGIFNPIRQAGNYRFLDAFVSLKLAYYL